MNAARNAMDMDEMPASLSEAQGSQEPALSHATSPVVLRSQALFGGQRELLIMHNGEAYRLRITRQDKLILTK